jgi:hypothetical protein
LAAAVALRNQRIAARRTTQLLFNNKEGQYLDIPCNLVVGRYICYDKSTPALRNRAASPPSRLRADSKTPSRRHYGLYTHHRIFGADSNSARQ